LLTSASMFQTLLQPNLASNVTSLFWYLSLAHWLGDYPLQSNWIAQRKTNFWVLLLHVTIHFLLLLAILYPASSILWPYLLSLAAFHFILDISKNWFKIHRPTWVTWPYLVDQLIHITSLAIVASWIYANIGGVPVALPLPVAILACGLVLVTFVWTITEKVLWARTQAIMGDRPLWPWKRLVVRAGLYAAILLGRQAFLPLSLALSSWLPYSNSPAEKRALMIDVMVSLTISGMVMLALPG
jgi:hypothetical protein